MSLLFSDSLKGIIDEESLSGDRISLGKITVGKTVFEIDGFIFDKRAIRVHAIAEMHEAVGMLQESIDSESSIILGEGEASFKGKIQQIGWEQTLNGGRLVIGVIIRDK